MTEIQFRINYRGQEHIVKTHLNEYRNLMALLYDKFYFEDFGDCKGIGRCGTCHIKVEDGTSELKGRVANEQTTLNKMEYVSENSRLSCQILVDKKLHQAHFSIADDGCLGLY